MYHSSFERLGAMFECVPVQDRDDIPIYPQLICWAGKYAGHTQKEIFENPDVWIESVKKVFDDFGYPDTMIPMWPHGIAFGESLPVNLPGKELGDDELFQFEEKENLTEDDYQFILEHGWDAWYFPYLMRIQKPPFTDPNQALQMFGYMGQVGAKIAQTFIPLGVPPISNMTMFPLFDQLSLIRSFGSFIMDLFDMPDTIKAILEKNTPGIIAQNIQNGAQNPNKIMHIYAMRSDANVISPDIFDEFSYPYLKQMILGYHEAGYKSIIHADGNWTPFLDRFLDLPKAVCHFEFDGVTDIFAAAQILDGHHSFRGDVPATMLAYGTPDEVSEYCEKLITEIGLKTPGFMLGTGCEVPLNCKPENYEAMMKSLPRYQ